VSGEDLTLHKPLAAYAILKSKSYPGQGKMEDNISMEMDKSVSPGSPLKRENETHPTKRRQKHFFLPSAALYTEKQSGTLKVIS